MTEPTTTPERGTEQPSEGLPIPTLETPSSVSSPSSVDTEAIAKQVAEQIRRELRMAQSTKDKEINAIKKTLGISDLSELEAMGATIPDNVKLETRLRQLEGQRTPDNSPVQQPSSPGNGAALTATDVSEVVRKFKLDANTPEVLEALRGTYRNRDHFEATLAGLALAKIAQPQPSAAEALSLQSAPPSGGGDEKSTRAAYDKEIALIAQTQRGDAKIKAIADLKVKYREKGVQV